MKTLLILLICSLSFFSYSQEKKDNLEKSKRDLVEVRLSISKVDEKIQIINSRVDFSTETPTSMSALNAIDDLKKEKERLQKIEFSILSHIGANETNSQSTEKIIILKSDFDKLPLQNQEQILAHPERYQVQN
jgi:cell division protein ZapA (FtsZ GTPase activity inhibitor)